MIRADMIRTAKTIRAVAASALLALAACGGDSEALVDDERPPSEIFAEGDALAVEGQWLDAAQRYDDVERLYPYSQLAKDAMLRSALAYFRAEQFDRARLAAERFLSFYPTDPAAAQAQYLIANSWYAQIVDVGRDQGATREALAALRQTVQRYPGTEEARSARLKLDLTLYHLAGKEMAVGRYYLKREHYVAAINRFRTVIEQYQTTSHTPEALYRLVEAYLALGVPWEAQTAAAVLGHNFPGSSWYAASFDLLTGSDLAPRENSDSWISRAYRQVIQGKWL
jgi:outer membrane protein assembly factor BamD